MTTVEMRRRLDRLAADYEHACRSVREERLSFRNARQQEKDALTAQQIVQEVAEATQKFAHSQIANVVSRCLEAVFDDEAYKFVIDFAKKRGKTEAVLTFVRDGMELTDPTEEAGLGQVDVAALALRLACLILSKPERRRLLVLDEPCKWTSKNYRPAIGSLIVTLAKEFGIQFVIVTHAEELAVGHVIDLEEMQ